MSVTFTRTTHTYNASADTYTTATSTITGSAVSKKTGAAHLFRELGLVSSKARLLLFTPNTYGDLPREGDTVSWESETWTVSHVYPLAPDGVVIFADVVIVK